MRFAVVRALFNEEITAKLLAGALAAFEEAGVRKRDIQVHEVPGAFELPLAAQWLATGRGAADAVVCLGCVIRGETPHFEYVAGEAARGIAAVSRATGVPVIFGVLTTENKQQALRRSARVSRGQAQHTGTTKAGNKGYEAAQSALRMAKLRQTMRPRATRP